MIPLIEANDQRVGACPDKRLQPLGTDFRWAPTEGVQLSTVFKTAALVVLHKAANAGFSGRHIGVDVERDVDRAAEAPGIPVFLGGDGL